MIQAVRTHHGNDQAVGERHGNEPGNRCSAFNETLVQTYMISLFGVNNSVWKGNVNYLINIGHIKSVIHNKINELVIVVDVQIFHMKNFFYERKSKFYVII